MSSQDFIGSILTGFSDAFHPLEDSLPSLENFEALLTNFGWALDATGDFNQVAPALKPVVDALLALDKAVEAVRARGPDPKADQMASLIPPLADAVKAAVTAIRALESGPVFSGRPPTPLDKPEFWASFAQELLEWLLYTYLRDHQSALFGILHFLGVLTEHRETRVAPFQRPYIRRGVHWDRIPKTVTAPKSLFADVYGWGTALDHLKLLDNLAKLLGGFRVPVRLLPAPGDLLDIYYDTAAPARGKTLLLRGPLYSTVLDVGDSLSHVEADLGVMPVPPSGSRTQDPTGFSLFPMISGDIADTIHITDGLDLSLKGGFESDAAVRAEIRPDGVNVVVSPALGATIDAHAVVKAEPSPPWILIGSKGSTRLELASGHLGLAATGLVKAIEYGVEAGADKLTLVLDFGEGDGFLQKILGGQPQSLDLSVTAAWSSKTGFHFGGKADLEVTLPVHQSVAGVLTVDTIYLGLKAGSDTGTVALVIAVTGGLSLGPLVATVDRVGLEAKLKALDPKKDKPGILGDLDFEFGFKQPNGLGLSIDASAVTGGGFLFYDEDKQQYAGGLQLAFNGISLTAVGLLTTRMPDGSHGFSLLIIITAKFPPIQLGFGFSLTGVGGLLGLNRTMVLDVLREGVKNRTLDSIMFPDHPIEHAAKIVSDLSRVFPPAPNRFVIGPMAIITWGNPECILTAQLGIILEIPAPVRLAVLGKLTLALPNAELDEKDILILVHMDVVGTIDFQKGDISIDATLYQSRIAAFALSGDMAMRANVGADPNFALAVGGFNPRFQPPPNFPSLARLSLSLATSDNPRLRLDSYLALTSNTLQFGANLDFRYELSLDLIGKLAIAGNFGFDALFHFSPFQLAVDMGGSLWVYHNSDPLVGISVDLHLTGPAPWWHAWGTGTIHFLGKHTVSFDVPKTPPPDTTPLPAGHPGADLVAALANPSSWSAQLPPDGQTLISLRDASADGKVFAHPLGQLAVRQKVVPLDITITRYGNTAPDDGTQFKIKSAKIKSSETGQSVSETDLPAVKEYFAPANFFDLNDDEKLSRPSFELQDAGVQFGRAQIRHGQAASAPLTYDETVLVRDVTSHEVTPGPAAPYTPSPEAVLAHTNTGARAQSPMLTTGAAAYRAAGLRVALKAPTYAVTHADTLTSPRDLATKTGLSYTQALQAMRVAQGTAPNGGRELQVVAAWEKRK